MYDRIGPNVLKVMISSDDSEVFPGGYEIERRIYNILTGYKKNPVKELGFLISLVLILYYSSNKGL
jgi:hypothetical protein